MLKQTRTLWFVMVLDISVSTFGVTLIPQNVLKCYSNLPKSFFRNSLNLLWVSMITKSTLPAIYKTCK